MINYGRHLVDKNDIREVVKVLKSNFLTTGPKIKEFENNILKKFGGKHCSVVNNGTSALHLLGAALNWGKKDFIATTPITFLADANCIVNNNANPEFIDIDKKTYTMDPNKLEERLKKKKIKAVIAVDFAGHPCDWKSLNYLSKKYEFTLINDACHSIGAEYFSSKKYAINYADYVTHSYHPVKAFTTGEGGCVISKNKKISRKIELLRNHSIKKEKHEWKYKIFETGMNYRISDIHCALGISQLKKVDKFIKERRKIADFYIKELKGNDNFILPYENKNCKHAFHLFPLLVKFNKVSLSKERIFKKFLKKGIKLQVHYIPVHLQPYYRKNFSINRGELKISEDFYKKEISIPIFPGLKKDILSRVIKELKLIC